MSDRGHHVAVVRQRLAHAHEHDVGDDAVVAAPASRARDSRATPGPTISAVVRLRLKPCCAVEQNEQSIAQPTCEEMHSVPRSASGMYTISIAWPLPTSTAAICACRRTQSVSCTISGSIDFRALHELGTEILGEVGHRREVAHTALVHPLHELARAEGLAAHLRDERLELGLRQAEQVGAFAGGDGGHRKRLTLRGQSSEAAKKYAISIAAFSAVSEPCTMFASMLSARSARIVPGSGLLRIGGAHQFAILGDGVLRLRAPARARDRRSCTSRGP